MAAQSGLDFTPGAPDDNATDPLANFLRVNNVYEDLYQILRDNDIDLDTLQNDVPQSEMDTFCAEFGFTYRQKLKFRKLMRVIYRMNADESADNDSGPPNDFDTQMHNYRKQMKGKYLQETEGQLTEQQPPDPSYNVVYDKQELAAIEKGRDFLEKKEWEPTVKIEIVLIGDSNVGKTSLMRKYVNGIFSDAIAYSIGIDSMIQVEKMHDDTVVEMTIWDTAGQERFQGICRNYYRRADCIIVCYDVNDEQTFDNCSKWRDAIEEHGNDDVVVILVGCKGDVSINSYFRKIVDAKARSITTMDEWKKFEAMYCECSAKTGDNVRNVFLTAAELALTRSRRRSSERSDRAAAVRLEPRARRERGGCCNFKI